MFRNSVFLLFSQVRWQKIKQNHVKIKTTSKIGTNLVSTLRNTKHYFVSLLNIKDVVFDLLLGMDLDLLQLDPLVDSSSHSPQIKRIKELEAEKTKYKFHIISTLISSFS